MNAAARMFNQGALSRGWVISLFMSRAQFTLMFVTFTVLFSGLSMVLVTNTTRSYNAQLQQIQNERNQLHVQWGQLLLEKSTMMMQARIQTAAENELNMKIPNHHSVVVIKE